MKRLHNSIALFLLFGFTVSCQMDHTVPNALQVFALTEQIGGRGYNELTQEISKWTLEAPFDKSPANDPDGSFHVVSKQPLPDVMFLEGNFGGKTTRSLTIPSGRAVFAPVFQTTIWYYENDLCDPTFQPAPGQTLEAFLHSNIVDAMDGATNLTMKLDGQEIVPDLKKYRVKTKVFQFMPDKEYNFPNCDYTKKTAMGVSDGFALLLKLPKGRHVLTYGGDIDATGPNPFHEEMTWNLTVE